MAQGPTYIEPMKRRTLLGALAALSIASPVMAQTKPLSLDQLSSYLNSLTNAEGAFTQVNPDGTLSKGTFYLKRPGRMRFEYEPPNDALVVAGQGTLAIFDKKSNAGPQQYPLHRTPLHIILKDTVNLNTSGMVVAHEHDGTATTITAQDPEHPTYGNVKLVFTDNPTELRQWIVTDESGQKTTVVLGKLVKDKRLQARLFDVAKIIKEGDIKR
ncbi:MULTISPECIES: outer membrane lipoprotein carrier protein LolA [Rhodobacterales]|uniref:LolA family protein n=1 Tax=Roseobacter sp. N2S TaxID=2663844 RepID=UPI002856A019|nr:MULTISPECIES: outer membrane lipoprotein carrier protein LolA [Rhodobacterales]MDR6263179.1 outer membrane lipoprotein-sorting protein [Roseobacter sp. N2S]